MSDKNQKVGPPDSHRINVNEPYELQHWTRSFSVSAERLRRAVNTVGTSAEAVRKYLAK